MSRSKGRAGKYGTEDQQYLTVPYVMARSPAWRSLSGPALKVWFEIRTRYNGKNNGDLSVSLDEAARLLGLSKSTVQRAYGELVEKGFLQMTKRGRWYGRMATTYAVTDRACNGHLATRAWQRWRSAEKKEN